MEKESQISSYPDTVLAALTPIAIEWTRIASDVVDNLAEAVNEAYSELEQLGVDMPIKDT